MRPCWTILLCAAVASPAAASDLNLSVESGGSNVATASPGQTVNWSVVGELSDGANAGLAFFLLDVSFDGGDLSQADTPSASPMTSFAMPNGLTNPVGFGGSVLSGDLIQVGGAQNTINNTFASVPIGSVSVGVASPGSAETLVTGSLTAPTAPGIYTLSVSNAMANVVRQGETGTPFWAVDAAGIGDVTQLTLEVVALTVDVETASIAGLGVQNMSLDAGIANAGRSYYMLGSISGTSPGLTLGNGTHIPLNFGPYFDLMISLPNVIIVPQSGALDGVGQASAAFVVPPGTPTSLIGVTFQHAYLLLSPKNYASNVVDVTLVP